MDVFGGLFAGLAGAVPCLMFAAVATLIIGGIIWAYHARQKRREAMARLAAELGLQYYPDDAWGMAARYSHLDLFQHGSSRRASNILTGLVDGRELVAFDYQYTTGSGKNQTTHHYQAVILTMPITGARLMVRRESFLDRMASWVGWDDIDFESDEFSRRYHVACQDRKFAYDVFHARLIEYMLACGQAPMMEFNGPLLLVYENGHGDTETLRRLIHIGRDVIRSIPDYVLNARGLGAVLPGGRP
jgi:hypothetical protein